MREIPETAASGNNDLTEAQPVATDIEQAWLTYGRQWRVYGRPRFQRRRLHRIGDIAEYDEVALAFDHTGCWRYFTFGSARDCLISRVAVRTPKLAVMDGGRV
jgi:hypothetical protein